MNAVEVSENTRRAHLVNLYHLAQTALDNPTRYDRMVWASNAYHREYPLVPSVRAYKMLEAGLAPSE